MKKFFRSFIQPRSRRPGCEVEISAFGRDGQINPIQVLDGRIVPGTSPSLRFSDATVHLDVVKDHEREAILIAHGAGKGNSLVTFDRRILHLTQGASLPDTHFDGMVTVDLSKASQTKVRGASPFQEVRLQAKPKLDLSHSNINGFRIQLVQNKR